MWTPPHARPSSFVVCAAMLVTAAWFTGCDAPVAPPPEPASPSGSPQSSAASVGQSGVCDRTWQVRDEIMDKVGKDDCAEVTDQDLAGIRYLNLAWYGYDIDGESAETCEDTGGHELGAGSDGRAAGSRFTTGKSSCPPIPPSRPGPMAAADGDTTRITALKEGDLDGLTGLWYLTLEGQGLRTLPGGIFDDMNSLTDLSLSLNLFRTLPEGVFDELANLEELDLSGNLLSRLPEHIFDELGDLETLDLLLNNLPGLPADVFDGLGSLDVLNLTANRLAELPAGVFDELVNLSELLLDYNRLTWADTLEGGILALLDELNVLRHAEAGGTDTYYHGVFAYPATRYPENWSGILGVAYIAGWSGLSLSHLLNGQYYSGFPVTVAHELGHNLGLRHAPCGRPAGLDPRYPYSDGNIGIWGHDFGSGGDLGRLLHPEGHYDLMSYCEPAGISDFHFTSALDYRDAISASAMARRAASARETLLLWGSIRDGEPRLEPVFEWTAPVKLPESPGPYRLVGADATGRSLFQLSFTPDETGDGDRGFLFAIETEEAWARILATVTLAGPEGSFVVDGSHRGAIITDRATGRIVSIARDWEDVLNRDGAFPRVLGSRGDVVIHRSLPRPG